jgi:Undecaprenyl-phosphate glucose phosphotransferase
MAPPPSAQSTSEEVIQWAQTDVARPGWYWPVSYASISATVCVLDIAIIIATSVVTGAVYSLVFHDSGVDFVRYGMTAAIIGAMFVPIFRDRGLYDPSALVNWSLQARKVAVLWTGTFLVFAGAVFALKVGKEFSRGAVLSFGVAGLAALLAHRAVWRVAIKTALQHGRLRGRKSILLCMHEASGDSRIAQGVTRDLAGFGYKIVHFFDMSAGLGPKDVINQVIATARGSDVEEIFFAADLRRWSEVSELVRPLSVLPIPLTLLPDQSTSALFQHPPRQFGATVGVEFQRAPLTVTERFLKRFLDVVCATCGIVLLMPMFVIVALAIKLDSPGPALFMQTRHGFNSKRFKIFKFRSMRVSEDGVTVKQAVRDDERVTRVGMWLRKTSIDELPQLFNVLIGDMSIVGPRPHATAHDDYFADLIGRYAFRHHVKPGITGWAQVQGYRGETPTVQSMKARVDLDIWYVNNWNLPLDIRIILRTVVEVLRGRNAY